MSRNALNGVVVLVVTVGAVAIASVWDAAGGPLNAGLATLATATLGWLGGGVERVR